MISDSGESGASLGFIENPVLPQHLHLIRIDVMRKTIDVRMRLTNVSTSPVSIPLHPASKIKNRETGKMNAGCLEWRCSVCGHTPTWNCRCTFAGAPAAYCMFRRRTPKMSTYTEVFGAVPRDMGFFPGWQLPQRLVGCAVQWWDWTDVEDKYSAPSWTKVTLHEFLDWLISVGFTADSYYEEDA